MFDIMGGPSIKPRQKRAGDLSTPEVKRVGVALGVYGAGLDGPDTSEAWVELNEDGGVTVGSSWEDHGQGADSGALGTAHEALRPMGIPAEKIRLVMNDTSKTPNSGPAGGSALAGGHRQRHSRGLRNAHGGHAQTRRRLPDYAGMKAEGRPAAL